LRWFQEKLSRSLICDIFELVVAAQRMGVLKAVTYNLFEVLIGCRKNAVERKELILIGATDQHSNWFMNQDYLVRSICHVA